MAISSAMMAIHALSEPGSTELAVRAIGQRLELSDADIRDDLERAQVQSFEETRLYARIFALADRLARRPAAHAVLPQIQIQSPKLTRKLTTEWFASRVVIALASRDTSIAANSWAWATGRWRPSAT
jgi:hypothetical protein